MRGKVICSAVVMIVGCSSGAFAETTTAPNAVYVAHLVALNSNVTGMETSADARFAISGDKLTITVNAENLPPSMMHLQHFHGLKTDEAATCPTAAADVNHDGIIDLIETEPMSGMTMVPLHSDPANMQIVTDTYPRAGADGTYHYRETLSLKALQAAFAKAFGGKLDFDRRVVFIHGVPPATKLPKSTASLGTIPAQVTLPIACGEIKRAQ